MNRETLIFAALGIGFILGAPIFVWIFYLVVM